MSDREEKSAKARASRAKGSRGEREVAKALFLETGIKFSRNLKQYQQSDLGDLVADDEAWPFLLEVKLRANGTDCREGWIAQATKAARAAGKIPVVVYKFDRHPVKCRVPIEAIAEAHGAVAATDKWADVSLPGLAYIAREIMARRHEKGAGSGA
jgi:Holliday junction resolvase